MENFVVSARKYRPDRFDKVVGQQNITNTLKNAVRNNHLAQAFLFSGPRGVGKTTVARLLAKTLNCTSVTNDIEPCNECNSCRSFNKSSSFNVHELDAASNNSVEDIRSLVDQVRIPPQAGAYKVYIIDEVHMLSTSAFNAFLKTLEEPPSYAKFILATTEKHKIIPTILSRCQSYDFHRIPVNQIRDHLLGVAESENVKAEVSALQMIAQKADGALRDALSIFDQVVNYAGGNVTYQHVIENLNILDYDYYFRLTDYLLQGSVHDSLLLYEEITVKGFGGQQFLSGLGNHFRNLLVCRDEKTVRLLEVGEEIRQRYLQTAVKLQTVDLLKMISIINKADLAYRSANNKRLQVELALLQAGSVIMDEKKNPAVNEEKQQLIKPPETPAANPAAQPGTEKDKIKPQDMAPDISKNKTDNTAEEPSGKSEAPSGSVKLKKKRNAITSISLKDDMPVNTVEEPEANIDKVPDGPAKEVDATELKEAIEAYAIQEAERKPSFVTDVKRSEPKIGREANVELLLTNKIYAEADYILDLQRFLREKLNNPFINLVTEIQVEKATNKVFTSKEKYERMVRLNADFENFKKQLDLDYE